MMTTRTYYSLLYSLYSTEEAGRGENKSDELQPLFIQDKTFTVIKQVVKHANFRQNTHRQNNYTRSRTFGYN
ncbi:unnamed protein product [Rotaria socialis]